MTASTSRLDELCNQKAAVDAATDQCVAEINSLKAESDRLDTEIYAEERNTGICCAEVHELYERLSHAKSLLRRGEFDIATEKAQAIVEAANRLGCNRVTLVAVMLQGEIDEARKIAWK